MALITAALIDAADEILPSPSGSASSDRSAPTADHAFHSPLSSPSPHGAIGPYTSTIAGALSSSGLQSPGQSQAPLGLGLSFGSGQGQGQSRRERDNGPGAGLGLGLNGSGAPDKPYPGISPLSQSPVFPPSAQSVPSCTQALVPPDINSSLNSWLAGKPPPEPKNTVPFSPFDSLLDGLSVASTPTTPSQPKQAGSGNLLHPIQHRVPPPLGPSHRSTALTPPPGLTPLPVGLAPPPGLSPNPTSDGLQTTRVNRSPSPRPPFSGDVSLALDSNTGYGPGSMSAFNPAPGSHPSLPPPLTHHTLSSIPYGAGALAAPGGTHTPPGSSHPAAQAAHHLSSLSGLIQPLLDQADQVQALRMEVGMWKAQWGQADKERQRLERQAHKAEEAVLALKEQASEGLRAGKRARAKGGFSVVLLDGDGLIFNDELTSAGYEGGSKAAKMLLQSMPLVGAAHPPTGHTRTEEILVVPAPGGSSQGSESERGTDNEGVKADTAPLLQKKAKDLGAMLVMVFLNKQGLGNTLVKAGIVPSWTTYEAFWQGFSRAHELFTVIDVGTSKEASDAKIREHLKLFAKTEQCEMIVLGASHDNGYAHVLSSLQTESRLSKLLLLKGYEDLAAELRQYSSLVISMPDVFRSTKVTYNPTYAGASSHGPQGRGVVKMVAAAGAADDAPQTPFPVKSAAKKAKDLGSAGTGTGWSKKPVMFKRAGVGKGFKPKFGGAAKDKDRLAVPDDGDTGTGTGTGTSDGGSELDVYEFDELSKALDHSGQGTKSLGKEGSEGAEEEEDEWVPAGGKKKRKAPGPGGGVGAGMGAGGAGKGGGVGNGKGVRERSVRELHPRPCHTYYLSPWGCRSGDECDYGHHYNLSEQQIGDLTRLAKQIPCPFAKDNRCRFAADDCVYGHKCPRLGACTFGDTCRFNILPHAHEQDSEDSDGSGY